MTIVSWIGIIALILLGMILLSVWRMVRSPLPLEMQQALEKKEQAKLDILRDEWSKRLSEEIQKVWNQMQGQVQTTEQTVSQKLQQVNDTVSNATKELGRLHAAIENVEQVGRNVASLQDLLRAPKIRGGIGEFFLADLLAQIMPADFYSLQYGFSDGERVDAVIRMGGRLVPVDAKFPLENFRRLAEAATDQERADSRKALIRNVKGHVDAIADKYIRPSEGTFDFALMYIPAENVYYEVMVKDDEISDEKGFFQHAIHRKVIPVSPNSFYAYLLVILQGLRGFAVEERAKEILAGLSSLHKDISGLRDAFDLVGRQINNASQNFTKAEKHLSHFEDRLKMIESSKKEEAGELSVPAQESLKEV